MIKIQATNKCLWQKEGLELVSERSKKGCNFLLSLLSSVRNNPSRSNSRFICLPCVLVKEEVANGHQNQQNSQLLERNFQSSHGHSGHRMSSKTHGPTKLIIKLLQSITDLCQLPKARCQPLPPHPLSPMCSTALWFVPLGSIR